MEREGGGEVGALGVAEGGERCVLDVEFVLWVLVSSNVTDVVWVGVVGGLTSTLWSPWAWRVVIIVGGMVGLVIWGWLLC